MSPLEAFRDRYAIWWMVELPLLALVICGALPRRFLRRLLARRRAVSVTASVRRGDLSWRYLGLFYGGFSAVVFAIPLAVEAVRPYQIVLAVLNLAAALYLCFFNGWFRNKVIGLITGTRNRLD